MNHPFLPRDALMLEIALALGDDPFLTLWALRRACQMLDLRQLTELLNAIDDQDERDNAVGRALLDSLLRERYNR